MRRFKFRKLLSVVLVAALAIAPAPAQILAEGEEVMNASSIRTQAAGVGIDRLTVPAQSGLGWGGSTVYFGMNSRYPMEFRVLDRACNAYGTTSVLLDSDKAIFRDVYSAKGAADWNSSDLKMALNNDILLGMFSESERKAIIASNGNGLNGEKVFLLSKEEAVNNAYGYGSMYGRIKTNLKLSEMNKVDWFLRSSDASGAKVVAVAQDGGERILEPTEAAWISPALNLNPQNVVMTWTSTAYKPGTFSIVNSPESSALCLTIRGGEGFAAARKDSENVPAGTGFVVNVSELGTSDWNVTYTQISAMLVDANRNVIAYGPVSDVAATGDLLVNIPAGIVDGAYTLKLFAEDCNSKVIEHGVDYASNVVDIPVTIGTRDNLPSQTMVNPAESSKQNEAAPAGQSQSQDSKESTAAKAVPHRIVVLNDGNGKASANVDTATVGTLVTLTATPSGNYKFKAWSSKEVLVSADNKFTMPDCDVTVTANFKAPEAQKYKVIAGKSDGGTIKLSTESAAAGDKVEITPIPNQGYRFQGWNIPNVATDSEGKYFLMPAWDTTVYAVFTPQCSLTLKSGENGTLTASPEKPAAGEVVTLIPRPYAGYHFKGWKSDQVDPGTSNTFIMPDQNVTVKAVFEADADSYYFVGTKEKGSGFGSIVLPYGTVYEPGDKVEVDVTCPDGYDCTELYVSSGDMVKYLDTYGDYFVMPASDVTVVAFFE